MYLVQLLLPVRDNEGAPFPESFFIDVRNRLTERFGGVTAYLRSPAQGLWRDRSGDVAHDEVVIIEVMCSALERDWWSAYRAELAVQLRQQELVVRALPAEPL